MRKFVFVLLFITSVLTLSQTYAGSGIFDSKVILGQGGSFSYWSSSAFNNHNFGAFTSNNSFILFGGQLKTWKNGNDDITGAALYYRIYEASASTLPAFDTLYLPWKEDVQSPFGSIDQTWELDNANYNILSALNDGNYIIEIFFEAFYTLSSQNLIHTENNGGINYKAFFSINNCTLDLGPDLTFCSAFSFTLDAGNGHAAYQWNTSETTQTITVSQAGTFTVTITNAHCNATDTIIINAGTSAYTLNIGNDTTICGLGTVTLNTGGGFMSYLWTTGETTEAITVNTSGVYSVSVLTSENCWLMDFCEISFYSLPYVDMGSLFTLCVGDSLVLDAGPGFVSYLWSDNSQNETLSVYTPGNYAVTVTDAHGCTGFDVVAVTYSDSAVASFTFTQTQGLDIAFTDMSQNSTQNYWDFIGNGNFTAFAPGNVNYTYPSTGNYTVKMIASNACNTDTATALVNVTTSTNFLLNADNVICYPNPTSGLLFIESNDLIINKLTVSDLKGIVQKSTLKPYYKSTTIDLSDLSAGMYVLEIETKIKKIKTLIIKE